MDGRLTLHPGPGGSEPGDTASTPNSAALPVSAASSVSIPTPGRPPVDQSRRGLLYAFGAYALWGVFPLYFPLAEPATPLEILAHRVFWSAVLSGALLLVPAVRRDLGTLLRSRRRMTYLTVAALVLAVNWYTYIWAVNSGEVVQASLGYYVNPLVSALLGVIVLHERLRRLQWISLGIGFVAVVWLTVEHGGLPWTALALAFSFGSYGLFKKQADAPAVQSLAVETAVLTPAAIAYLAYLVASGQSTFGNHGAGHTLILISLGVVTAVPLLCFAGAATRIPLSVIGMLQYMTPTIQLALGVFVLNEPLPGRRLAGFVIVWIALALLMIDGLVARHTAIRATAAAASDARL